MAKMFAIRYIKLRPEITAEEFEPFIRQAMLQFRIWPAMNWIVAKGDHGDRAGRYALFEEFASIDVRNHYFPADGVSSVEAQQLFASSLEYIAAWDQFGSSADDKVIFTDYAVIGEF